MKSERGYENTQEQIDELTEKIRQLELQQHINVVDRNWSRKQKALMVHNKYGIAQEPTEAAANQTIGLGVLLSSVIFFFGAMAGQTQFAVAAACAAITFFASAVMAYQMREKAIEFQQARDRYRRRRSKVRTDFATVDLKESN